MSVISESGKSVLALAALLAIAGCDQSASSSSSTAAPGARVREDIGTGALSGQTYTHDFFGLSVTIPDGWHISNQTENDELIEIGSDVAAAGDQGRKAVIRAAIPRTLMMITAFEHPPGTPVPFNANIIVMAESVRGLPGVKSGREYLQHLQTGLAGTELPYELDPIEEGHKLGTLAAHCLPAKLSVMGNTVKQRYYATRISDYAIAVILSYQSDEQLAALENIVTGMKLGK
jgi:hypothetical protein